jgi:diaminopimelate epimerase
MSDASSGTDLAFAKLEGLGNDFVLIDRRIEPRISTGRPRRSDSWPTAASASASINC